MAWTKQRPGGGLRAKAWLSVLLVAAFGCDVLQVEEPLAPLSTGQAPGAHPPAHVVGSFGIQLPEQLLQPGQETFPCYLFPIDVEGPSRVVGGGKLTASAGMHHGNITTRPRTGDGIRPCEQGTGELIGGEALDILNGGSVLFGSSTQIVGEEWQSFPEGMGFPIIDEGFEIVARMHYLNASAEELAVTASYEWFTIDESKVEQLLGPFLWMLSDWAIPPHSSYTAKTTCFPPTPMHLVNVMPHMHALGTEFFGAFVGGPYDGQRWLDSVGYDPDRGVVRQYVPAMDLSMGDGVTFGCTWDNHFDKVIVEGTGDNEMCMLFGYAYPPESAYSARASELGCAMAAPPAGG